MEADVVIAWGFAPVPKVAQSAFKRPTKFIALPTPPGRAYGAQVSAMTPSPIRWALAKYAPGVIPLRVACLGFSESCHGVRNLLKSSDGLNFDAAIAIDGIHTPYGPNKSVDPNMMQPWLEFAKYAVVNERLCAITHSSVVPPTYASTTQTANWLWGTITNDSAPFAIPPVPWLDTPATTINVGAPPASEPYSLNYPAGGAQKPPKRADGLVILGYSNLDPPGYADHIWQAKVMLPAVVTGLLAKRWNELDPSDPSTWS